MKFPLLLVLAFVSPAAANLVITEVMSSSRHADPARIGDWWELTNTGAAAVNLQNYSWDDSPPLAGAYRFNAGISIQPGESVVILDAGDAASFKTAWGLTGPNPLTSQPYQVLVWSNLTPGTGNPGLSSTNPDGVYLFSPAYLQVAAAAYITPSAAGFSRAWFTNGVAVPGEFSVDGQLGAVTSTDATPDVASPCHAFAQPANTAPYFTGADRTFWSTGRDLAYSLFRIQALDADAGQIITYAVTAKPAWLVVSLDGAGKMRLSGTPPANQPGDFTFTVRATDNAPSPLSTDKTFTLTVFPPSGPVLLNEYNAVGSADLLDPLSSGSDTYFGVIAGNGGDWFELVVTGTGIAGSTVDLRGWRIEILAGGSTKTIVLSNDPYWSNVIAGTILTFTEDNTANGGLDTTIHKSSSRNLTGHVWSNIWIRDPVFIDQTASDLGSGITIDNDDTWFTIRNPSGTVVLGPCGEGIASDHDAITGYPTTLASVSSQEVLALRSNPAPSVDPLFGQYTDQSSSSFGSPNVWSSGTKSQSFLSYYATATPPRITSTPVRYANGSYSYAITATDPNGSIPVVSAAGLPPFLTFSSSSGGGIISHNRPLTLADAGEYIIRVEASDGSFTTPQAFVLTVFNPTPGVILNEYNAVDTGRFLNGGTLAADSDGGAASTDLHFGRIDANGGDWFELVVTGSGTAGTVDLRGWRIEIGQPHGPLFAPSSTLVLSADPYWAAVPTGTILTFIERNTAQGGLDTGIERRNRRATLGDAWTNIWIGDPAYLTYTDPATNGYEIIDGLVTGVAVDNLDTRLRIKDAAGRIVSGPAGEGVSPPSGVGDTSVLALQADPLPTVSPLAAGYQADVQGSSFGWPNAWPGGSQSFTPYVQASTLYASWVAGFHLSDPSPAADPDGDGRSNQAEYAFGGNPGVADAPATGLSITRSANTATWQYARRADDPGLTFSHQQSPDLATWLPLASFTLTATPHPTLAGFELVTVSIQVDPPADHGFFRAVTP